MHAVAECSERRRFVPLEFHTLLDSGFFRADERPWLDDGNIIAGATGDYRRFTTNDLERMADLGLFDADGEDRIELIDGEILTMSRVKAPHASAILRINSLFVRTFAGRALVSSQTPLRLDDDNQPQPDLALLRPSSDFYAKSLPKATDAFLVVELMDTTHYRERNVKLPRYAAAGVREVWLVDLPGRELEVCREPSGSQYLDRRVFNPGQSVSPAAFPDVVLAVDDFIGS